MMPLSKGTAEQSYMLQAQEQGTGTIPQQHGDSQGMPSLSLQEGEERDWGEPLWPAQPGTLGAGGEPEGSASAPLHGEGDCSGWTVDVTVCPVQRPLHHSQRDAVDKASMNSGSQDITHSTGEHAPWQPHPHCCGEIIPEVSWQEHLPATQARKALEPSECLIAFPPF